MFEMLSSLGREMYFPKGILTQSAEAKAKAKKFNATLGVATEGGHMMFLPSLMQQLGPLSPDEALNYAPVAGLAGTARGLEGEGPARQSLARRPGAADEPADRDQRPDARAEHHGRPLLRAGRRAAAAGPDLGELSPHVRRPARREDRHYPFYGESGGFNVEGFRAALLEAHRRGTRRSCSSTSRTTRPATRRRRRKRGHRRARCREAAEAGLNVVAIVDDAYFGLFYEPEVMRESLFTLLAGGPERLLAVKCDAATKEVFVWGLRVGFLSFSAGRAAADSPLYAALEKKVCGQIRGVLSNCSMLSQRATLKALLSPTFYAERQARQETLRARAEEVQRVLADKRFDAAWEPHRFNSGYFMCLKLKRVTAESAAAASARPATASARSPPPSATCASRSVASKKSRSRSCLIQYIRAARGSADMRKVG